MAAKPRPPRSRRDATGSARPGNPRVRAASAHQATPGFARGYLERDEGGRYSKTGRGDDFSTEAERARDRREETTDGRGEDLTGDERGRPRQARAGTPESSLSDDDGFGAASGPAYEPARGSQPRVGPVPGPQKPRKSSRQK